MQVVRSQGIEKNIFACSAVALTSGHTEKENNVCGLHVDARED